MKRMRAFTLIETLIVVAILSILVAIAVPALNTAKEDARSSKKAAITASVATAKMRYTLKVDGIAGTEAKFAEFKTMMLLSGVTPALDSVANKENNGTGQNVTAWGRYPDGENASPVLWGTSAAVTE